MPALAEVRHELAALDPVLAIGLAKKRDDRFASCVDFADALAEYASSKTVVSAADATRTARRPSRLVESAAPATRVKRRLPKPLAWTLVGASAIAVIAAVAFWRLTETRLPSTAHSTTVETAQSTPQSPPATAASTPSSARPSATVTSTATAAPSPSSTVSPLPVSRPPGASGIVPGLVFPPGTLRACDEWSATGPIYGSPPPGQCSEPGQEHWVMQTDFGQAQQWLTSQMAELGQQPYSTYGDGPSTSWGRGTQFRVTVEMNQSSTFITDVYVVDVNSVKGARR